jgi:hypothetical protein
MKHLRTDTDLALPTETDDGTSFGEREKTVVSAILTLEQCDPDPTKRIVSVITQDGWTYRFVRFSTAEPLVHLDRVRPTGEEVGRGHVPEAVREYADAVESGEIQPDEDELSDALSEPISADTDAQTALAVADGGRVEDVCCQRCDRTVEPELVEHGLCPLCRDQERQENAHREQELSAHPTVDDPTPRHEYRE